MTNVRTFLAGLFSRWARPAPNLSVVPDVSGVGASSTAGKPASQAATTADLLQASKPPGLFDQDPPGIKSVNVGKPVALRVAPAPPRPPLPSLAAPRPAPAPRSLTSAVQRVLAPRPSPIAAPRAPVGTGYKPTTSLRPNFKASLRVDI